LLALVENRIAGLVLQTAPRVRLGEMVSLQFRLPSAPQLSSVAFIKVTSPSGREMRYYGGNQEIKNGAGGFNFRTALNDPTGTWRVSVTDTISGETANVEIIVQ
jgi:hypothetical protein